MANRAKGMHFVAELNGIVIFNHGLERGDKGYWIFDGVIQVDATPVSPNTFQNSTDFSIL